MWMRSVVTLMLVLILVSCSNNELDSQLDVLIKYHRLSADALENSAQQPLDIHSPRAQLGKILFFSPTLSGDGDVACASCHHPLLGGDDDLALSVGVNPIDAKIVGTQRKVRLGQPLVARNAPTTFNSSLWKKSMFYDGRVERLNAFSESPAHISTPDVKYGERDFNVDNLLQAQAGFPVTSQDEMRDRYKKNKSNQALRKQLTEKIIQEAKKDEKEGSISWRDLFEVVYPQDKSKSLDALINFKRIQTLLADYEQSQLFVNNPWFAYLKGDKQAINDDAKKGALLFYQTTQKGGAGCVACHSGTLFSDEKFHVLAVPHAGEGKDTNGDDYGRFLRTGIYDDRYAFRTPSLLNIALSAPYGHSGVFADLESMIRHHLDPEESIKNYDFANREQIQKGMFNKNSEAFTQKALAHLKRARQQDRSLLTPLTLSDKQIGYVVEFLNALTDPCTLDEQCLSAWLPNDQEPNPGGRLLFVKQKVEE